MSRLRIECNFGCRYFDSVIKAYAYFKKCRDKFLPVEVWAISYEYDPLTKERSAIQVLIDFVNTDIPKH